MEEIRVLARRQDGDTETMLARAQVRLLSRLSGWRTADELGVAEAELDALVAARCAFWSTSRHPHVLTGAPLDALEGKVALAGNVFAKPLVGISGAAMTFSHMPRRGSLDDATLAGVRLNVHEWDTEIALVTIRCCARHAHVLRDLIGGLDGRATVEELAPEPDTRAIL